MKINARDYITHLANNIENFASEIQPLWHPLGFASCVVGGTDTGTKLRAHYWPPHERRTKNPDWPIHTHSYDLSSLVLKGQIEDVQYEIAEGGDYFLYKVSYSNIDSEITKLDKNLKLLAQTSTKRSAGDEYRVERGIFHQSHVDFDKEAITFVALSNWSNDAPLVLGQNGEGNYPYDRTNFDRELFWSAVRNALNTPKG